MGALDLEALEKRAARLVDDVLLRLAVDAVEVRVDAHIGTASDHLVRLSAVAQLLVVGARGYDRASHDYLGSVASKVTRRARCPVVVVP